MINVIAIDDIDKLLDSLEDIKNNLSGGGSGGGLPDYSLTEKKTGQKWIDGKDVYFRTFTGSLNGTTSTNITDIPNIDTIISYSGMLKGLNFPIDLTIPYSGSTRTVSLNYTPNNHLSLVYNNSVYNSFSDYNITVYYTKV